MQVNELSLCLIDIGNIWKVISSHISIASQRSKRFIAELPLRAGAHVHFVNSLDVHTFMNRVWALLLTEVQQYGALNAAMQSKYATE